MITPQQIDQVAFKKSSFGGYNMQQVDEFLEPLTEDYVTLYKENALLKSKLRVLAGKLEEYRKGEGAAKASAADPQALQNAQAQAAQVLQTAQVQAAQAVKSAQAQAAQILADAQAQSDKLLKDAAAKAQAAAVAPVAASVPGSNAEALIAAENARVEEARKAANARIAEIQEQMRACIQALERIKAAAPAGSVAPAAPKAAPKPASFTAPAAPVAPASFSAPAAPKAPAGFAAPAAPAAPVAPVAPKAPAAPAVSDLSFDSGSVADEIAHSVEALVGSAEEPAPKPVPKHPVNDTTTSRFANLNLQFGRNYDPTHQ